MASWHVVPEGVTHADLGPDRGQRRTHPNTGSAGWPTHWNDSGRPPPWGRGARPEAGTSRRELRNPTLSTMLGRMSTCEPDHGVAEGSGEPAVVDVNAGGVVARARALVRREAEAVHALAAQLDDSFISVVERVRATHGKVVTLGAGTSGLVAERLAHLLSVCGTPAFYLPVLDALHGGVGAVTGDDVVIAFSKGGRSEELTALVALLEERGVDVVAVTEAPTSPFALAATTVVSLRTEPADADLGGLVATGSTLVASAWGDGLTAVLMELRGHTLRDVVAAHPAGVVGLAQVREGTSA
jgi:D-arabinose 5-phosphate isomerase GutQ